MAQRQPTPDRDGAPATQRASHFPHHLDRLDRIAFPLNLLLGFAPFVTFTVLSRLSISFGLWAAFAFAFALGLPEFLHTRTVRTLDGGGIALFGLSALLSAVLTALSNFNTARFVVIVGMLAIALTSFIRREPFVAQYMSKDANAALRRQARLTTAVWALAFAVMMAMDGAAVYVHGTPERLVLLVNFAMLAGATIFTLRYPLFMRGRNEAGTK
ncbi:MAG TPA: hypothetical protein VMF58_12115 [Rhizomicrobium sp.]|nr:hypothetical protein [Rhizomicrobium sp.]